MGNNGLPPPPATQRPPSGLRSIRIACNSARSGSLKSPSRTPACGGSVLVTLIASHTDRDGHGSQYPSSTISESGPETSSTLPRPSARTSREDQARSRRGCSSTTGGGSRSPKRPVPTEKREDREDPQREQEPEQGVLFWPRRGRKDGRDRHPEIAGLGHRHPGLAGLGHRHPPSVAERVAGHSNRVRPPASSGELAPRSGASSRMDTPLNARGSARLNTQLPRERTGDSDTRRACETVAIQRSANIRSGLDWRKVSRAVADLLGQRRDGSTAFLAITIP